MKRLVVNGDFQVGVLVGADQASDDARTDPLNAARVVADERAAEAGMLLLLGYGGEVVDDETVVLYERQGGWRSCCRYC